MLLLYNLCFTFLLFIKPIINPNSDSNNKWIKFDVRPEDPCLSCFFKNNTWYCIHDTDLKFDIDDDDSY